MTAGNPRDFEFQLMFLDRNTRTEVLKRTCIFVRLKLDKKFFIDINNSISNKLEVVMKFYFQFNQRSCSMSILLVHNVSETDDRVFEPKKLRQLQRECPAMKLPGVQ